MSAAARRSLENRLGNFLGFQDESLSDVLDHLLSIEGSDDLLDYLSQLLGDDQGDDIKLFVQDIGKFQRGEEIAIIEDDTITPDVPAMEDVTTAAVAASKKQPQEKTVAKTKPGTENPPSVKNNSTSQQGKSEGIVSSPAAVSTSTADSNKPPTEAQKEQAKTLAPAPTTPAPPPKKRGPPPRGKATRNCGCFGTLHKPLTNCLYCGRISCETEGYDFCPFCGFLVEEVKPPEGKANSAQTKAWQHKERLLRYDRESAERTVVLDDQADYYSNQTSHWLTEEEQIDAETKDEEQRTNIHDRKKQVLNIAF